MKTIKYGTSTTGVALTGRGFDVMPEKIYENLYHIFLDRIEMKAITANRKNIDVNDVSYINKYDEEQLIIFILTDALRPDHMSLYGYERDTTPFMKANNFIAYNDMYACETVTSRSVPCLLTNMERNDYYLSYFSKPSIFTMFKKADFYTALLSAQGAMGALAAGQKALSMDADYSFLNTNSEIKYDIELLEYFDKILKENNKNKLILLHINGSHWDYNTRFKEENALWHPLCKNFGTYSAENFVNSYDNTILATDMFVKSVVERVKNKNAVIYFSSDHGQMLGEGGLRLHAQGRLNFKELAVVPFAVWYSDKAKENIDINTVIENRSKITTHDIIFHSITSCAGIKSSIVDKNLSICSKDLKAAHNEFENYISKKIE